MTQKQQQAMHNARDIGFVRGVLEGLAHVAQGEQWACVKDAYDALTRIEIRNSTQAREDTAP